MPVPASDRPLPGFWFYQTPLKNDRYEMAFSVGLDFGTQNSCKIRIRKQIGDKIYFEILRIAVCRAKCIN